MDLLPIIPPPIPTPASLGKIWWELWFSHRKTPPEPNHGQNGIVKPNGRRNSRCGMDRQLLPLPSVRSTPLQDGIPTPLDPRFLFQVPGSSSTCSSILISAEPEDGWICLGIFRSCRFRDLPNPSEPWLGFHPPFLPISANYPGPNELQTSSHPSPTRFPLMNERIHPKNSDWGRAGPGISRAGIRGCAFPPRWLFRDEPNFLGIIKNHLLKFQPLELAGEAGAGFPVGSWLIFKQRNRGIPAIPASRGQGRDGARLLPLARCFSKVF